MWSSMVNPAEITDAPEPCTHLLMESLRAESGELLVCGACGLLATMPGDWRIAEVRRLGAH